MIRPINMNSTEVATITFYLNKLDAKKLTAYARRENICPAVFLRDVIAAGIKSYEMYGVI